MITYARYVHESRLTAYLRLGWLERDRIYEGDYVVLLCIWPCQCPMVEPKK